MKRGISFEIPNTYGRFLGGVLQPFQIPEYMWLSGGEESYLVENGKLDELLFTDRANWMDGKSLEKLLQENNYYLIFVDLKAFPKGKKQASIETYGDFLASDCELVVLVIDSIYVTIYCKDKQTIEDLYVNAQKKGFHHIQYITKENDTMTRMSVW